MDGGRLIDCKPERTASNLGPDLEALGVDPAEQAPRLALPDKSRPIDAPYVCIAVQSSTQAKYGNNPNGWRETIRFLKQGGYRVVCIDQKPVHGQGPTWIHIRHGAEDETSDRPLTERARWLRHAAAFIGLSRGLSWLAWAAATTVVMMSGLPIRTTSSALLIGSLTGTHVTAAGTMCGFVLITRIFCGAHAMPVRRGSLSAPG